MPGMSGGQFPVDRNLGVCCLGSEGRHPQSWGSQGRLPGGGIRAKPREMSIGVDRSMHTGEMARFCHPWDVEARLLVLAGNVKALTSLLPLGEPPGLLPGVSWLESLENVL